MPSQRLWPLAGGIPVKEGAEVGPEEDRRSQANLARIRRTPEAPNGEPAGVAIGRWLQAAGVPKRHITTKVDHQLLPEEVRELAQDWRGQKASGSLVLAGPVGCGKTTAAVFALEAAYWGSGHEDPSGIYHPPSALFVRHVDLVRELMRRESTSLWERARRARVLVVDDLGAAHDSAWPVAEFQALIDHRWGEELPTIATTNLDLNALSSRYPQAVDRICSERPGYVEILRESMRWMNRGR